MYKLVLDLNQLRTEITRIQQEAFSGIETTDDKKRRDILLKVNERLKTLRNTINQDGFEIEVK
jgi:hypothetical protein